MKNPGIKLKLTRSHFITRFRGENEQFLWLAMSENEVYLEDISSLSETAKRKKGRSQQKLGL